MKIKIQIQHLRFIEELLQKILTIEERCFSWKTSQPGICRIGVEKFYRSYSQPPSSDRTFCRNSCEMWSENRWRYIYKIIHIKSNCQMYIQVCSFSKARDIVQKFWVSETTQKKHLKSGICWKDNAYYPAFSCFTGWSCPGIFFYSNTYTDCLVAEFPVLEHLYSTSLLEVYFLFSVENEKLTEVVNA